MNAPAVLADVLSTLDAAGIPYMLTGSFASAYHGTPRATQDIDVVIAPTRQQLRRFVALLTPSHYYVDEGAALDALEHESQFNVLDSVAGWKIDLIIRKSRPFSRTEFARRVSADFDGASIPIASAEDLVIAKLEWAKLGASERQIDDVAGILRVRGESLDQTYIERWVENLALERQWERAVRQSTD